MLAEPRETAFSRPGWIWELKYDGYRLLAGRRGRSRAPPLPARHGRDGDLSRDRAGPVRAALRAVRSGRRGRRPRRERAPEVRPAPEARPPAAARRHRADVGGAAGHAVRVRPARLRGFRPALPAARTAQGPPPEAAPPRGARALRRPRRGTGQGTARGGRRPRAGGRRRKKADAPYRAGRSADWIKVRLDRAGDFAVVGCTLPEGSRSGFGALHLAFRKDGAFVYAGRVGTGFTQKQLDAIRARLDESARATPPCSGPVPTGQGHLWVEPSIVCEVRYKEWTSDGLLRHPAFLRLREDKTVEECAREEEAAEPPELPARARRRPRREDRPVLQPRQGLLARRGLHQGRPDRVLPRDRAVAPAVSPGPAGRA